MSIFFTLRCSMQLMHMLSVNLHGEARESTRHTRGGPVKAGQDQLTQCMGGVGTQPAGAFGA
jgi:hypothetical protein